MIFVRDVFKMNFFTLGTEIRMDDTQKRLIHVDEEITRETESLFQKIRSTLATFPPRKQLYGVEFELQFAQVCGSVYAISTFTSSVLRHVLQSMNLSEGDEVICPAWLRSTYIRSILATKLVPVFSEITPYTLGLDFRDVSMKLSPRTKVILLVHSCGIPADLEAFTTLCKEKNLKLIEIVPCGLGSTYRQKVIGTFGTAGIIEYHPQHSYSDQDACILLTDIETVARRVRSMSFYEHTLGTFSELQGALGLWDISKQETTAKLRKDAAYRFDRAFEKVYGISIFHEHTISQWGHQKYPIRVSAKIRDELLEHLLAKGFKAAAPRKPANLHSYIQTRLRPAQLLITEKLVREIILLPTSLSKDDQDSLIETIQTYFQNLPL